VSMKDSTTTSRSTQQKDSFKFRKMSKRHNADISTDPNSSTFNKSDAIVPNQMKSNSIQKVTQAQTVGKILPPKKMLKNKNNLTSSMMTRTNSFVRTVAARPSIIETSIFRSSGLMRPSNVKSRGAGSQGTRSTRQETPPIAKAEELIKMLAA